LSWELIYEGKAQEDQHNEKICPGQKQLGQQHVKQKKFTSNGFVGGGRLGKDITLNMLKLMMKIITAL